MFHSVEYDLSLVFFSRIEFFHEIPPKKKQAIFKVTEHNDWHSIHMILIVHSHGFFDLDLNKIKKNVDIEMKFQVFCSFSHSRNAHIRV